MHVTVFADGFVEARMAPDGEPWKPPSFYVAIETMKGGCLEVEHDDFKKNKRRRERSLR